MVNAFYYGEKKKNIHIDSWTSDSEDEIFKTCKGALVLPVSNYYGINNPDMDYFILSTKRCYNSEDMRNHISKYMNYFEKYYDNDQELLLAYFKFKYLLDFQKDYSKEIFFNDIKKYIFSPSLLNKAHAMNEDCYMLDLDSGKKYKNDKNPSLIYNDRHVKTLMWMSLLMNMSIPLLTHYIYISGITDTNTFLLEFFQIILGMSDIDIFSKLYETALTNIYKNSKSHSTLWQMQDIRSKNVTTHTINSVANIILNIMPKYTYDKNIIFFNYASIKQNNYYQVVGIEYEFNYISLSNAKRDEENNSMFD